MESKEVTTEVKDIIEELNGKSAPDIQRIANTDSAKTYHKAIKSAGRLKLIASILVAAIIGFSLIMCCFIGARGIIDSIIAFKKDSNEQITIKGYATEQVTSDLITWSGHYQVSADNSTEGYNQLSRQKDLIEKYMKDHGISDEEMVFSAVGLNDESDWGYDESDHWVCFKTYVVLDQTVTITSTNIDLVTELSRSCSDLLSDGIRLESYKPEYSYTNLDELKMNLLSVAAADALDRAGKITEGAGGTLGALSQAKLSNISVTPLYDNAEKLGESYYYGKVEKSLASKEKEITVTVSCTYEID